ncbi:uncharacterized protein [Porites lutea]|uniref:uncharacterized protein n=1 Tax=Porites lutea TaxID=51062 RepID=UPI003CC54DA7
MPREISKHRTGQPINQRSVVTKFLACHVEETRAGMEAKPLLFFPSTKYPGFVDQLEGMWWQDFSPVMGKKAELAWRPSHPVSWICRSGLDLPNLSDIILPHQF